MYLRLCLELVVHGPGPLPSLAALRPPVPAARRLLRLLWLLLWMLWLLLRLLLLLLLSSSGCSLRRQLGSPPASPPLADSYRLICCWLPVIRCQHKDGLVAMPIVRLLCQPLLLPAEASLTQHTAAQ